LLAALKDVPIERRTARYRTVLVVVFPDGRELVEEGTCEGIVVDGPAGANGFGYDPIVLLPERGLTMAQLSPEEKNRVSHRGIAAAKLETSLLELAEA
jgi:XTP/dITP diphosphohydrolase